MRKIFIAVLVLIATSSFAQDVDAIQKMAKDFKPKFGIKAGYNWSYLTGSQQGFKPANKSGFMIAAFYSSVRKKGIGHRSEIVFSRQGYSFENGGKNTDVLNDYIYIPQLVTFGLGKLVQLQAGAQIGFLLNSNLKSDVKDSSITSLMNRIDYGFAAGVEVNPFKGLIIGGRYNLGLGKLYKHMEENATHPFPLPFNPQTTNFKNALVQFFVGYRF